MMTQTNGWRAFEETLPILTCTYSFGPGEANALAVGIDGGLMVVTPPRRAGEGAFEALARYGPVRALVAPNAFHHMGLAEWHARFPQAAVFAPAQAVQRVQRQSGVPGIRPVAEAAALLGPHVDVVDMPHYKTGVVLVRVRSPRGLVWFVTDVVLNLPRLPDHPVPRLLFRFSRSAPGLRFNNIAPLFMVQDKAALKRWLAKEAAAGPPSWLLPCHGDIVDLTAKPETLARLFA
jgi:hypothetical protein